MDLRRTIQADFLVYLLAVDEKGRTIRADERRECRMRGDDAAMGG